MDRDSDASWWFAGLLLGAVILLLLALLDMREEVLDLQIQIQTKDTKIRQLQVDRDRWTCSRVVADKGALKRWCISSSGV